MSAAMPTYGAPSLPGPSPGPNPPPRTGYSMEEAMEFGAKFMQRLHPTLEFKIEQPKPCGGSPSNLAYIAVGDKTIGLERDSRTFDENDLFLSKEKAFDTEKWKGASTDPGVYYKLFENALDERGWPKGTADSGTEDRLMVVISTMEQKLVVPFVIALGLQELREKGEVPEGFLEIIPQLDYEVKASSSSLTTSADIAWSWTLDFITHYLTYKEGKRVEFYTKGVSDGLEAAIDEGQSLVKRGGHDLKFTDSKRQGDGDLGPVRGVRSRKSKTPMSSAPSSARTSKNKLDTTSAPRVVGQIYEGLVSKKVEEAMLTSLYGCCYMVRLAGDESNPVLKFSQNLIPEEVRDAASDEALRASLDTYRELSRACFLQAMRGFRRFHARWWQWTREAEEARDKARLKVAQEKKVSAFEGAAPVRTSWVTRLELLLTDAVEIAGQLLKLDWSINLLSSCMFWTKKTSFTVNERFEGDETVVYTDYGRGLVFKRFFEEEKFRKELSLYEMLKGVDFVPSILGTVSQPEWWGILMSSEGESIPVDDVEDPSVLTFINRSLTILHDRHIHHHDIAARNILERSDGTLVLIDFANGAFDWECRKMEVEDEIICEDEETLDFASPSDPLTDFCSLV